MKDKAYTPDEVAQIFQISKHTVYELIKRGELRAFKVGNKMRIKQAELERYKDSMKAPAKKNRADMLEPLAQPFISIRFSGSPLQIF